MTGKETFYLKMALEKDDPIVRTGVGITHPVYEQYGDKLDWMSGFSKYVGVGISKSPGVKANTEVVNQWHEKWIYPLDSLDGICVEHPISSWDNLNTYVPPDPDAFTDWKQQKETLSQLIRIDFSFFRSFYLYHTLSNPTRCFACIRLTAARA